VSAVIFVEGPPRQTKLVEEGGTEIDLGHVVGFQIEGMNVGEKPRTIVTYSTGVKVIFE
jgi:hypothetical protein